MTKTNYQGGCPHRIQHYPSPPRASARPRPGALLRANPEGMRSVFHPGPIGRAFSCAGHLSVFGGTTRQIHRPISLPSLNCLSRSLRYRTLHRSRTRPGRLVTAFTPTQYHSVVIRYTASNGNCPAAGRGSGHGQDEGRSALHVCVRVRILGVLRPGPVERLPLHADLVLREGPRMGSGP